jgi:hypothetical protein
VTTTDQYGERGSNGVPMLPEDCMEYSHRDECSGSVMFHLRTGDLSVWPRCVKHGKAWQKEQDRIERTYPDSPNPPAWFDPAYAGEVWDDSEEDIPHG